VTAKTAKSAVTYFALKQTVTAKTPLFAVTR